MPHPKQKSGGATECEAHDFDHPASQKIVLVVRMFSLCMKESDFVEERK